MVTEEDTMLKAFTAFLNGLETGIEAARQEIQHNKLGKPTEQTKSSSEFNRIKKIFPSDLTELLTFEEQGEIVYVKPVKFLGADNFARIFSVAKLHGGKYVSAGKKSHFIIPKFEGNEE